MATMKLGLRNITYNMESFCILMEQTVYNGGITTKTREKDGDSHIIDLKVLLKKYENSKEKISIDVS